MYQNHAGARYLGATMWDLVDLLEGIPQEDISIGFDVRHAKVEAGLSWPVYWEIARPHLGGTLRKDFVWDQGKVINVPLGQGWVGEAFFHEGRLKHFQGPITFMWNICSRPDRKPMLKLSTRILLHCVNG